ncbi:DUF2127 domain-containing protein [Variovorax sp. OV329]|uniref:DUF2127 domain-containing protein n=1 Tax=Variovorax sp. OV329 TaxID=1882825 RepID=UPI0008EC33E8|nr:DUF2127 domain-containing protein [Variovorax sp. OV329]SFN33922.1 Uncharacterized membrane protein, DUF2068 family [Variovorax sp. OV329]
MTAPANKAVDSAVRLVAFFEAAKGVLVLLVGTGVIALRHKGVYDVALSLIAHAHLNPASRYPHIFLDAASDLQNTRLLVLAGGAACYAALRFVEAFGLLFARSWAEMLAALSGAIYVPFEIMGLWEHRTLLHAGMLVANLAIVALMLYALVRKRRGLQSKA